jgi:hypothetical protein
MNSKILDFSFNAYLGTIQGYVTYTVFKCNSQMSTPLNNADAKTETIIIGPTNRKDFG